jgi:phage terminase large subunit-like protein
LTRSRRSIAPEHPTTAYARAVVAGEVMAGHLVRLACQRHLDDLEHGTTRGLTFDKGAATRGMEFFATFLRHADGQPFTLAPFQQFLVGSLHGWKEAGVRRFRHVYFEGAKGTGKSPLASGLALSVLFLDEEPGSELYCAAVTREQARIQFTDCTRMAQGSPDLARQLEITDNNIAMPATGSFIRPVSSEARALDGKRVSVALIDELMEHPNADVYDKMRAGVKTRRQPLILVTTNSGYDRHSVAWRLHEYSVKLLEGVHDNDAWFALIFALDPCAACRAAGHEQPNEECEAEACDDWKDERVWEKANPLLDRALPRHYLREQVEEALAMPSKQSIVKRLNFSIWTESVSRWLDQAAWVECGRGVVDPEALRGRRCFAGLDASTTMDLTAFVLAFPDDDGGFTVLSRFWLPREAMVERVKRDHVPYDVWARIGALELTEGHTVDYDIVRERIKQLAATYQIVELVRDRWNTSQLATQLMSDGANVVDFGQGFQSMSAPAKELERLVKEGKIRHGANPVMTWCASNAVVEIDPAGNIKPSKRKSTERIDGVVALCMALGRAIVQTETRSVYEDRGVIVL